jgi:hypothetical protein
VLESQAYKKPPLLFYFLHQSEHKQFRPNAPHVGKNEEGGPIGPPSFPSAVQ